MFKLILFFTTTFVVCIASDVSKEQRFGSSNLIYYYYSAGQRNPTILSDAHFPPGLTPVAPFNNDWDIIIIIHGHGGSGFTTLNPLVKDAFLSTGNYNVVIVDWSSWSMLSYEVAKVAMFGVGSNVATFIDMFRLPQNKIHIVGFDLGAHAAGYASRVMGGNIARITGLNPSARDWENDSMRLNVFDAQYVEVIHTDGTGPNAIGLGVPIGHIDFYVNGRSFQPGCTTNLCNHNRAYEVFAATITHPTHFGHQCSSDFEIITDSCRGFVVQMGGPNLRKFGSGMFRVTTGFTYPYNNLLM